VVSERFAGYAPDYEKVVQSIEKVLYSMGNLSNILTRCLEIIVRNTDVTSGVVYLVNEHRNRLEPAASFLAEETAEGFQAHPVPAQMMRVLRHARSSLIKGELERRFPTAENTALHDEMDLFGWKSLYRSWSRSGSWGSRLREKATGRFYTPEDENVFGRFAHYLSLTIENFMLYTQLEEAKSYQESLLQNLPTGVIGVNNEGNVTIVNKEAERITGLGRNRIEHVGYSEVLPRSCGIS